MRIRIIYLTVVAVTLTGIKSTSAIQGPTTSANAGVIYRLNENSDYTEGCFAPCMCPIWMAGGIRGTFILAPSSTGGNVLQYKVRDVNWFVSLGDSEKHITGSGKYTRISGAAGWSHRLVLDLRVDHGDPQHFDSGLVSGGADFPDISEITISINGMFCYDIAITVDASPVPAAEIKRYALVDGSTYQEGCLTPCECPILLEMSLRGKFALVPLLAAGTVFEYAVVNADWQVVSSSAPPSSTFKGVGKYMRISGTAGWIHRMHVDLSVNGGPLTAFDSGLVNDDQFPLIDIAVAKNGFYCYDIVLHIVAQPDPVAVSVSEAVSASGAGASTATR